MAGRAKEERLKELVQCPMCFEILTNATILTCGHTFCKKCLTKYDEQQSSHVYRISCPVCRKYTHLERNRIDGLAPNFLVKGLRDELLQEVEDIPSMFCSSHSRVYRDIYCEVCEEFICLTCFIEDHQGHTIQKREQVEDQLEMKRKYLIENGKARKTLIETSIASGDEQRMEVHRCLSLVEKEFTDVFLGKVSILQESEKRLMSKLHTFRQHADKQFEDFFECHKELLHYIDWSITTLMDDSKTNLDATTVKARNSSYNDMDRASQKAINDEAIVNIKRKTELVTFLPADENQLAIGDIDFGENEATDGQSKILGDENKEAGTRFPPLIEIHQVNDGTDDDHRGAIATTDDQSGSLHGVKTEAGKTKASGNILKTPPASELDLFYARHADETPPATNDINLGATAPADDPQKSHGSKKKEADTTNPIEKVATIPKAVRQKPIALNIVRMVDLPKAMYGMAACRSEAAVVVGYGNEREGTDYIPVSGDPTPHLKSDVGKVYDITFLTNNKPVLSNSIDSFRVYNVLGTTSSSKKRCQPGKDYPSLFSDQHDKIYVVNGNPAIYIFHGTKRTDPLKVVSTGSIKPEQICVTKSGVMVVGSFCTPCQIRVFDKKGHEGSFIVARNNKEILCPAVDSEGRVYVASVEDGFSLTRYELEGVCLVERVTFQRLDLPQRVDDLRCWCYMVSLRPNLIAFATGIHLYFIELPTDQ